MALLTRYIAGRRKRASLLGHDIFADPGWDILLDLYVARLENREVSVKGSCVASGCPMTTALFWVGKLEGLGLVTRFPDPADRRRAFVRITGGAAVAIEKWIETAF